MSSPKTMRGQTRHRVKDAYATVTIVQTRLPQYRVPLFERMRNHLSQKGVRLEVVYGQPTGSRRLQGDSCQLEWGTLRKHRRVPLGQGAIQYAALGRRVRVADLVIFPEFAGYIPSYQALLRRAMSRQKLVAAWGHGPAKNDFAASTLSRSLRTGIATRFDWWFSYTPGTSRRLAAVGFPLERTSTIYNAIDTTELRSQVARSRRDGYSFREAAIELVYVGALREDKRVVHLVDIGDELERALGDTRFRIHVVGSGAEEAKLRNLGRSRPWLRIHGRLFGVDKAHVLAAATAVISPGYVGLSVFDGLCAGLPTVIYRDISHAPESEYLVHGRNAVLVRPSSAKAMAAAVVDLHSDTDTRQMLGANAHTDSHRYTIDQMAENFADGIMDCLRFR
jgi:L-malate glycosyltransferase